MGTRVRSSLLLMTIVGEKVCGPFSESNQILAGYFTMCEGSGPFISLDVVFTAGGMWRQVAISPFKCFCPEMCFSRAAQLS